MKADMYSENILDHYKNPRNFGSIKKPDVKHKEFNHLCGDEIEVYLKFEKQKIKEIKFIAKGCAISVAAASMLSEIVKGKSITEIKRFSEKDMIKALGVKLSPARLKCGLLAWKSLQETLSKK